MKKSRLITIIILALMILITAIVLIKTDLPSKVFNIKAATTTSNEAMFLPGGEFNDKIRILAGSKTDFWGASDTVNEKITKIVKSSTITAANKKSKNKVSDPDSPKPIYAWHENNVIYYYTEATKIYLNPRSALMFAHLTKLKSVDLTKFDTSKVTDMAYMFMYCESLTSLNLSKFDTSKVTNMYMMFSGCKSLKELDLSSFDTSKVTDMEAMFDDCKSLKTLNLSKFNTSKVTTMRLMFSGCESLTSLNISKFDTSKVTSMEAMFSGCKSLKTINLSSFDTSKVTDMYGMFYNCESLKKIDLSKFNTSKVTDIGSMFRNCKSLTSLNVTKFDTSKVTRMDATFMELNITSLNISNFDTRKVTDMSHLFRDSTKLKKIYVGAYFSTSKVTEDMTMFADCKALVGENGTKYVEPKWDKTYARVDEKGKPGYFTAVYKVKYHGNGGLYKNSETFLDSRSFVYDSVYPSSSTKPLIWKNTDFFVRTGYKFTGWKTKAGYSGWSAGYSGGSSKKWAWKNGEYGIGDEVKYQLDLYAQWTPITYVVAFNKNNSNATGTMASINKTYNVKTNAPANKFKVTGYKFVKWNTKANGSGSSISDQGVIGNLTTVNGSTHTLYAQWAPITYTIVFNANGGTGTMSNITKTFGVAVSASINKFTREGYVFTGWNTKADGTGGSYTKTIGNLTTVDGSTHTLYAQWKKEAAPDISKLDIRNGNIVVFDRNNTLSDLKRMVSNNNITLMDRNNKSKQNNNSKLFTRDKASIGNKIYTIVIKGDVDGDGEVNISDISILYEWFTKKKTLDNVEKASGDLSGDNNVDISDVSLGYGLFKSAEK